MNLALVTVDSLRADHVGCYGYERETTPNIDELASRSHVFTDTVAHACATRPSFPSLLTSTQGMLYGGFDHLSEKQVPLSVPLSEEGYATGGFHSNPFLSEEFGYARGFDSFSDSEDDPTLASRIRKYVSNNLDGPVHDFLEWLYNRGQEHAGVDVGSYYQDAESLTDEALAWVESAEEPWFLWIHYMDPHHPYIPPDEHQVFGETLSKRRGVKLRQRVLDDPEALSEEDWSDLVDLYDDEIRYTDAEIGRLIRGLDDATWMLTADHGEEFYEHENFGHKNRFYEEHIHVPLLFGGAGVEESGRHDDLVGLNDVPVTLLEEAGVEAPETYRGRHVLSGERDRVVGGWARNAGTDLDRIRLMSRTSDEKYIRNDEADTEQLYDLRDDPAERENLVGECGLGDHAAALDSFVDERRETASRSESVEIGDDIEERLENLGYK
jgi:arylsulfatase A-like enzyme